MTRLKSIKKPIAILAVLLCVFTLFSFTGVKTVKGAGATEEQITALYEEGAELVATTGVDPDGHFEKIYSTRYGVIDLAYEKMKVIYTFATTKYVLLELYTDEIISQLSYETEKRAFEIRDELYELLTVDENFATLSADELESFVNDFSEKSLSRKLIVHK